MAHGYWSGFYGNLRTRAKTLQDAPMRQSPPYSATLSNRSKPGRSGYLRSILCTLREMVTPLDGLGPGARSRRNLACIQRESRTSRLRRDRAPGPRPSRGITIARSVQSMPRRYPERPGLFRFDKVAEYGGDWRMGVGAAFTATCAHEPKRSKMHPCANHHHTRPLCRIGANPAVPDIYVACSARSARW